MLPIDSVTDQMKMSYVPFCSNQEYILSGTRMSGESYIKHEDGVLTLLVVRVAPWL